MHYLLYNGSMKIDIMQIHAILPIYWSMEIIQPRKGMHNSTHNPNISHNIKISVVNKDRIFVSNIYCTKFFFALTHYFGITLSSHVSNDLQVMNMNVFFVLTFQYHSSFYNYFSVSWRYQITDILYVTSSNMYMSTL